MGKSSLNTLCCVCFIALSMTSACKKDDDKKASGSGTTTDSNITDTTIKPPPPQTYWLPIEFQDTSGLYTNDTLYFRAYCRGSRPRPGGTFYEDIATGAERNGKIIYLKGDYYQATLSSYTLFKRGVDSISVAALVVPEQSGGEFGWYDPQKILSGDTTYHIKIKY